MASIPKVSVLLPVYNAEQYLKECIDSILRQDFEDFELLILDDCSSDESVNIIKSYSDSRIRFERNDVNLGISRTRNKLMSLARGEYWALSDNDDISLPQRFSKQVDFLDKHLDCAVVSCWMEFFPEYRLAKPLAEYKFAELMRFNPCLPHPCAMLRGSVIKEFGICYRDRFRYAEDYDLWFQIWKRARICALQEVLYKYRWDGQNATVKNWDVQCRHADEARFLALESFTEDKELQGKLYRMFMGKTQVEKVVKRKFSIAGIPVFKKTLRTVTDVI